MTEYMPRRHASLLTQLRTGHAPLNQHLHRINRAESPLCPRCGTDQETVIHYLCHCPAYESYRAELVAHLRQDSRSINALLSKPRAIKLVFKYIARTGRFKTIFGDLGTGLEDWRGRKSGNKDKGSGGCNQGGGARITAQIDG